MKQSEIPVDARLYMDRYHTEETVKELAENTRLKYSVVYSYLQNNSLPMKLDRPGKDTKAKPQVRHGFFNVNIKKDWMV